MQPAASSPTATSRSERADGRDTVAGRPARLDVSVVLPCLNEEETVGDVVDEAWRGIRRAGLAGEVIVVDNASTDRSAEVAAAHGARVVHEPERGYGRAYLAG